MLPETNKHQITITRKNKDGISKNFSFEVKTYPYETLSPNDLKQSAVKIIKEIKLSALTDFETAILEQAYFYNDDLRQDIDTYLEAQGGLVKFILNKVSQQHIVLEDSFTSQQLSLAFQNLAVLQWTVGCSNRNLCKNYCEVESSYKVRGFIPYSELRWLAVNYGMYIPRDVPKYFSSDPLDWEEISPQGALHAFHALEVYRFWKYYAQHHEIASPTLMHAEASPTIDSAVAFSTRIPEDKQVVALTYGERIQRVSIFEDNKDIAEFVGRANEDFQPLIDDQLRNLTKTEKKVLWMDTAKFDHRPVSLKTIATACGTILTTNHQDNTRELHNLIFANYPSPAYEAYLQVGIIPKFKSNFAEVSFYPDLSQVLSRCIVRRYTQYSGRYPISYKRMRWNPSGKVNKFTLIKNMDNLNQLRLEHRQVKIVNNQDPEPIAIPINSREVFTPFTEGFNAQAKTKYLNLIQDRFDFHEVFDDTGHPWFAVIEVITGKTVLLTPFEFLIFMDKNWIQAEGEYGTKHATLNRATFDIFVSGKQPLIDRGSTLLKLSLTRWPFLREPLYFRKVSNFALLFAHLLLQKQKRPSLYIVNEYLLATQGLASFCFVCKIISDYLAKWDNPDDTIFDLLQILDTNLPYIQYDLVRAIELKTLSAESRNISFMLYKQVKDIYTWWTNLLQALGHEDDLEASSAITSFLNFAETELL